MTSEFTRQYAALGLEAPSKKMDARQRAERIFQAALRKLGMVGTAVSLLESLADEFRPSMLGFYKLQVVRKAITENREADWNDSDEEKWGGDFLMNDPGFRFIGARCGIRHTTWAGGSRLCTFDEDDQEFFVIECVAFWADFYGGRLPK